MSYSIKVATKAHDNISKISNMEYRYTIEFNDDMWYTSCKMNNINTEHQIKTHTITLNYFTVRRIWWILLK